MNFLEEYGFTTEEIKNLTENIPPLLLEHLINSYTLVSKNLDYLKDLGVTNYKEIIIKFYDMFLMDNSNFLNIFKQYEKEDLLEKINNNYEIVEFL